MSNHVKGRPYPDLPRGPNGKLDTTHHGPRRPRIQEHKEGSAWMRSFAEEIDSRERDGYKLERVMASGVNAYEIIWQPIGQ